ncbi:bifunctional lysylphosphatidylglycerol flippase/synthetase MprF [Virgibacillus soli]|uniref:bifunctional lysylphosphatidylglycerol flippase/synthetase MprF n=1 Tax=Paracerasibacillus soli TaxID=480284 RepID=UPI0035EB39A7
MNMKHHIVRYGKYVFMLAVILFIFIQGRRELSGIAFKSSFQTLKELPFIYLFILVLMGLLAVAIMFFYDYTLIRSQHLHIKKMKVLMVSWIANAFNGIFGFGGLVGAGVRGMLYRNYTKDSSSLVKGIGWLAPAAAVGLSVFSLLTLIGIFPMQTILMQKRWLIIVLIGVFLFFPIYIGISILRKTSYFKPSLTVRYSLTSIIEWFGASILLYLCFHFTGVEFSFLQALGLFTVAAVTGFVSMIPGGLGSFDLMVISGGQLYGADASLLLTALFLYRFCYYIIPFVIALVLAAIEMTSTVMKKANEKNIIAPVMEISTVIWAIQRQTLKSVGYWSVSALSFIMGYFYIFIPIINIVNNHGLHRANVTLMTVDFYNLLLFALGITMWFFMKELYYRTKRSFYITGISLCLAIILLLFQIEHLIIAILSAVYLFVLILLKRRIKRHSIPFTVTSMRHLIYVSIIVFLLFVTSVRMSFILIDYPKSIYGLYAIGASGCLIAIIYIVVSVLLFDRRHDKQVGQPFDEEKLTNFLYKHGGHVLSHLGFLGDKRLLFSDDGKALLQFAVIGKNIVVLGDPQGEATSFKLVLKKLLGQADYYGYNPIFYQISGEKMALYHDLGYRFFKLGEEAVIDLTQFTISGKKHAGLRSTFNRFEKVHYVFEILKPPFTNELINELKQVSDLWLGNRREKQFSLGSFSADYISKAPIALLKNVDGKVVAFMTIMPVYQANIISIDLMRYVSGAPSGTIDALFIYLLQWAKEQPYQYFNLGMAPLSNVGQQEHAFLGERVAATIFNNVHYIYGFQGLRNFKNKYNPEWKGKYLAYRKGYTLASSMLKITHLIAGRKRYRDRRKR